MAKVTGENGRVAAGGSAIEVTGWDLDLKKELYDVSNTESSGFSRYQGGMTDVDFAFDGFWDYAANPHGTPPNLNQGEELSLEFYVGAPANGKKYAGTGIIESIKIKSAVKGVVTWAVKGKGNSVWTVPS